MYVGSGDVNWPELECRGDCSARVQTSIEVHEVERTNQSVEWSPSFKQPTVAAKKGALTQENTPRASSPRGRLCQQFFFIRDPCSAQWNTTGLRASRLENFFRLLAIHQRDNRRPQPFHPRAGLSSDTIRPAGTPSQKPKIAADEEVTARPVRGPAACRPPANMLLSREPYRRRPSICWT